MTAEALVVAVDAGSTATLGILGVAQFVLIPGVRVQERIAALRGQTAYTR